ncbi:MAG: hypothetical protein IPP80_08970 [Ignavibacteria bacterium]|nr:hypothetical protein [Ignavibacteria bacterium]
MEEKWELFQDLPKVHISGTVARLSPERSLYVGGYADDLYTRGSRSVVMFEAVDDKPVMRTMPDMPIGLAEMPVVILNGSKVAVVGGYSENGEASTGVYTFDVQLREWKKVGDLLFGRRQHAAILISNDEILVTGGRRTDLSTMSNSEVFNLKTGVSRVVASFPVPINGSVYGLMSDGRNVVCGGRNGGPNSDRVPGIYSYDAAANEWVTVGTLGSGREAPFSLRLDDGRFIIMGGSVSESPVVFIGSCLAESNGTFVEIAELPEGIVYGGASERGDGVVLVVGGWLSDLSSTARCQYLNVERGTVTEAPKLIYARRYVRSLSVESPNSSRRFSFAISGITNQGPTKTVEVLGGTDCSANNNVVALSSMRRIGSTTYNAPNLQLTGSQSFQAGAAWLRDRVPVANGFDVRFSFRLSNGSDNGQIDNGPQGADGVVMVLQNETRAAVGLPGDGIGYNEIPHGLAIEFDAYRNAAFSDPTPSHIAVQVGDGSVLRPWHVAPYLKGITSEGFPPFVADGTVYHARVKLEGKLLHVYCGTTPVLETPVLTVDSIDMNQILRLREDGAAYLGFTSSTGFSAQTHELLSVQIEGCGGLVSDVDDDQDLPMITSASIIPTPSADIAKLVLPSPLQSAVSCTIVDLQGNVSSRFTIPAGSSMVNLQLESLSAGMYQVVIMDARGAFTVPLVISR